MEKTRAQQYAEELMERNALPQPSERKIQRKEVNGQIPPEEQYKEAERLVLVCVPAQKIYMQEEEFIKFAKLIKGTQVRISSAEVEIGGKES